MQWLTNLDPSHEHDLTGLRDNFNPKARWKAAIAGARALHRFGSSRSFNSSSKSSGGWGKPEDSDDSDDDDEDDANIASRPAQQPSQEVNEHVQVTPPEDEPTNEDPPPLPPQSVKTTPQEQAPQVVQQDVVPDNTPVPGDQTDVHKPEPAGEDPYDSDASLAIPGSFSTRNESGNSAAGPSGGEEHHGSWGAHAAHLFKKLRL